MSSISALARRTFLDSRARNLSYALLFVLVAYANAAGYRAAYPTRAARLQFVRSFAGNAAVRLFYGEPHELLSLGGYSAWRTGGVLAIFAGRWGALAAVRALRAEEDSGRRELVLVGVLGRRGAYAAAIAAIAAGSLGLWLASWLGLLAAGLAVGEAALLALSIASATWVFAGVGALCSQLAPNRRLALELSGALLVLALAARVIADTSTSLGWLRWATPLGWPEEVRAFTGARPLVLLAPVSCAALLLAVAGAIDVRRDVGAGLLASRDSARTRLRGLGSPTALALRGEGASLAGWMLGAGFFALIVGLVSKSVSNVGISAGLQRELHRISAVSILTPPGYIGLCFLFFVLAASLFCCSQMAAVRHEEAEGRLETLLSLPEPRLRWFAGRLALAVAGAALVSLSAGFGAWLGAGVEHAHVQASAMLEAAGNCLPAALLFLGLAAVAYAAAPRASSGISYGLVAVAFVWELFGSLLSVPRWTLELSPLEHVGLVPAQPLRLGAALAMCAIGLLACALAAALLARRDLVSG